MQYDEFVKAVQQRADLDDEVEARAAIFATLQTLGERLPKETVYGIAGQLPPEVGTLLQETEQPEHFTLGQFYERVAARAEVELEDAIPYAQATGSVLRRALPASSFAELEEELPMEFQRLFDTQGS